MNWDYVNNLKICLIVRVFTKNGVISVIQSAPPGSAGFPARTKSAIPPGFDVIFAAMHHICTQSHVRWPLPPSNTPTFSKNIIFAEGQVGGSWHSSPGCRIMTCTSPATERSPPTIFPSPIRPKYSFSSKFAAS